MGAPRRSHTSIGVVAAVALFGCGKSAKKPIEHDAAPKPVAVDAAPVAPPTDSGESGGKITITFKKPTTPGTGLAKRCAIGGAPLAGECRGSAGMAFDKAGTLYITHDKRLLRYKVAEAGNDCKLEPDGDPIELPADNPRPQKLDGPVYMRSGGVSWELVQTNDAVYVLDFLVGLFRVDRGKVEPVCVDQFGFHTMVKLGKRLLAQRKGIEEVIPGAKCKVKSAGIDDKQRDKLFVVHDTLFAGFSKLVRYEGKKTEDVAPDTRFCAIEAMTACGDGACVLDHNCPKLTQLAADHSVVREIESDKLFDTHPYSLVTAATAPDGTVYMYALHRDVPPGGLEVCEAAVYAVPPAVFER